MTSQQLMVDAIAPESSSGERTVPLTADPEALRPSLPSPVEKAVLVVTSRPTSREALQRTLLAAHMRPAAVDRGSAVEELLGAEAAGRPFPIVLLDARKSEAAGFEVAEQIRRHPQLSGTRIVLLVAFGRRGDAARCRELEVAGYLTKPLRPADVVAAIETVLEGGVDAPSIPLVTRHLVAGRADPLHVLLADDDPSLRTLISRILEKRGHSVVTAENGRHALAALERESFDVLLTDVGMPGLDGLRLLEAVREREKESARRLPVVALTGHALEGDRRRLLEAGMDGYVAKPFQAEDLFFTLESVAGGSGSRESRRSVPSVSAAFDRGALLAQVGDDVQLLELMVSVFREDWPGRVRQLRDAIAGRRARDLADAAHALKGSIGTFRAADAFETARRLEFLGRRNDFPAAEEALRALEQKLQDLQSQLSQFVEEKRT